MDIKTQELENDIEDLKVQNNKTRWVIGVLVTLFGIITPLLFTVFSGMVNAKFDAIGTEIKAINQRLDYQEKLNSVQIQRDVVIEVNKQQK